MDNIFKALADKNRRKILTLLKEGEKTVSEILTFMDIGQATLSSHLAILRKAGMVSFKIEGKKRIYKLAEETLIGFVKKLNRFVNIEETKVKDEIIVRRINE